MTGIRLRLYLTATVIGLATAFGILSDVGNHIGGSTASLPNHSSGPWNPQQSKWHADSSTWSGAAHLLNPNIISGDSTVVCTSDLTLVGILNAAVARWNDALGQPIEPLTVLDDGEDGVLSACAPDEEYDVLLRRAKAGEVRCQGDAACYVSQDDLTNHRRLFSYKGSDHHSLLLWRNPSNALSTMVHELGHVLGLDDYAKRDNNTDNNCDHFRNLTVDTLSDQCSVMTYPGDTPECRAPGVITGRDLRDFYEAYHVGPLTDVSMDGDVNLSEAGVLTATFYWGANGAEELSHNARHVIAQRKTTSGWSSLGSVSAFVNGGMKQAMISIRDCGGLATEYRLVGSSAFRMGLNAFVDDGSLAPPVATMVEDPPSSCGTSSDSKESSAGVEVAIGDPTLVVGVAAWNGKDNDDDWCAGKDNCPPVLSASVTQSYCFTGAVRPTIIYSATGGQSDSSPIVGITGGYVPPPTLKGLPPVPQCHLAGMHANFTVTARWGLKADDPALSLALPARVVAKPMPVRAINESGGIGVSVLIEPAHKSPRMRT